MQLDNLIAAINAQHGLMLSLGERYTLGEQGAFAVRDAMGTSLVLKWSADVGASERLHRARLATDQLGARGYPVPRYRFTGTVAGSTYSLQEVLPGQPIETVTLTHLPRLFALNALQHSPTTLPASDWPRPIIESVLTGCDGYCVLASLEDHSSVTRALLTHLQALVSEHAQTVCATDDTVHFDFNPANILIDNGQISGVIDWEGALAGDRMFDLVTLLFYAGSDFAVRRSIWSHLSVSSTRGAISLYLAHIIVRQIDWSIRHHDAETVEHWLGAADLSLNELATHAPRTVA
jgi:aminoglycoside phosphotransferase (APT) family kinase protein